MEYINKFIYYLVNISFFKTFVFNVKYFGFFGIIHPKVFLSRNVVIKKMKGRIKINKDNAKKCHIGFSTNYIYNGKKNKTIFYNDGTIILNGNLCISKGCSIVVKKNGVLSFGENVHISQNTQIECHKSIVLENECVISWDCLIMDSDCHPIYYNGELINSNEEVRVGVGAWVGCRTIILKGGFLSNQSILAAGSILTKKMNEENIIVVNNVIVKRNIKIEMDEDIL